MSDRPAESNSKVRPPVPGSVIAEAQRRSGAYSDRHPDRMDSRLDRIGIGSDENCGGSDWALKKAVLEQSASDAARELFHPRAWVWETQTKPISIIGTERQQTVHSPASGVLALPTIAGLYDRAPRKLVSSRTKWEHTDGR